MGKRVANSYFQFKQFKVIQEKSPMKVCTDACILGASAKHSNPGSILDIGAGTGLLSLMLAQRFDCSIDAVEMHPPSCEEALANINNSPWAHRIELHCQRIQDFMPGKRYDLIISNPPFFKKHIKPVSEEKKLALHDDELPLSDLVKTILRLLSKDGVFYVLLPPYESLMIVKIMNLAKLHRIEYMGIRNKPGKNIFREVSAFSFCNSDCRSADLSIKDSRNEYTPEFIALLKSYYLDL